MKITATKLETKNVEPEKKIKELEEKNIRLMIKNEFIKINFISYEKNEEIIQSMSRKENCYDNCIMETFFGRMKNEMY